MKKIRVAISGYGNLGKGAEAAVLRAPDMELKAVFSRRDPDSVRLSAKDVPVVLFSDAEKWKDMLDVVILCGGSVTDLPKQTPEMARFFNVVDSFDTHARISEHFAAVDASLYASGHVGIISAGWDPGLFSLSRLLMNAVLPDGADYTFWGRGVSQGHSDAIRRISGVRDARQYTVPVQSALAAVRAGETPKLTTRQKHTRECYVVAEDGVDRAEIERAIVTMPNYFADYDTKVMFITAEQMCAEHSTLPHGGSVIRSGRTGKDVHTMEFSIRLGSNPMFTASVLVCCARAVARLAQKGETGARTLFDIPFALLSERSPEELRRTML